MTFNRNIEPELKLLSRTYPVVVVTGPRQSGKTTLVRSVFSDYEYINLENPNILDAGQNFIKRSLNRSL